MATNYEEAALHIDPVAASLANGRVNPGIVKAVLEPNITSNRSDGKAFSELFFGKALTAGFEGIGAGAQQFGQDFSAGVHQAQQNVQAFGQNVAQGAQVVGGAVVGGMQQAGQNILQGAQAVGGAIVGGVQQAGENLQSFGNGIVSGLGAIGGIIQSGVSQGMHNFAEWKREIAAGAASFVINGVIDMAKQSYGNAEAIDRIADNISGKDSASNDEPTLMGAATKAADSVDAKMPSAAESAGTNATKIPAASKSVPKDVSGPSL